MPYVPTEPVESSNIERIGYLQKQQILRVIFKGGRAYDYPLVTEREYRDFMAAESKGSFFNRRIKPMYGHRNPRPVELVEPCCKHEGSDTCTKACDPCNEFCCPGRVSEVSLKEIADAIRGGLAFGAADHNAASPTTGSDEGVRTGGDADNSIVAVVGESGCTRSVPPAVPLKENGEIDVEAIPDATALFVDGDADTIIETVEIDEDEGPEAGAQSHELNAADDAAEKDEEETNGNSD